MSMQLKRILNPTALGSLLALVVTSPVHAVDGVIEINQARAKAGGVTPGDTPLFPVTIDQPGSYRLTGNLDVTDASARPGGTLAENTTAIQVTADNVTIDLNGFMIKGPTVCSRPPTACSPTGTGKGIDGAAPAGLAVMNGSVRGMGDDGVSLGLQSQAERIRALNNGSTGISAITVTGCTANVNGGAGIVATTVTGCTAIGNGDTGISGTTVSGCTAGINDGTGISALTATACTATFNGGPGISATTATGCTATNNTPNLAAAVGIAGHNICGPPNAPCP